MKINLTKKQKLNNDKHNCGLCGRNSKTCQKTECCGNWVCGNESDYVMFSYSRDICCRNHRRFTLCGLHYTEGHDGDWKDCKKCLNWCEPEMVAWYGTNEYNFEKHPNPPTFEPTFCVQCKKVISLSMDGYTSFGKEYACEKCMSDGFEFKK
ncbi:hypothetical protein GW793_03630 [bacterium]|nr:hypothetical protein [bacterium]